MLSSSIFIFFIWLYSSALVFWMKPLEPAVWDPERDPTSRELRPRLRVPEAARRSLREFWRRCYLCWSEMLSMLSIMSPMFSGSLGAPFLEEEGINWTADSARRCLLLSINSIFLGDPESEFLFFIVSNTSLLLYIVGRFNWNLSVALSRKLFDGILFKLYLIDASVLDFLNYLTSGYWNRSISGGKSSSIESSIFEHLSLSPGLFVNLPFSKVFMYISLGSAFSPLAWIKSDGNLSCNFSYKLTTLVSK